ncbi:MAG: nucleoside hydrolase [Nitrospiraceae bacterium]
MNNHLPRRVILDTDPGVDDALAIALALRSPELDVTAITTVCGNVPVEQATRNLFSVLGLIRHPADLLIGQGAAKPLIRPLDPATYFHGADGLGELDRVQNEDGSPRYLPPDLSRVLPTAHEIWMECLRRFPDELTLITLGPLTNLARALESDPSTVRRFRDVICMGGAINVPGNVTPAAEFNIFADPDAARRVLESGLSITLVPLDVTTQVALSRENILALTMGATGAVPRFICDATTKALDYTQQTEGQAVFHLHDPLAVAVAIDPSLVQTVPLHVDVETGGHFTRGLTLTDRRPLQSSYKAPPNVEVALKVDGKRAVRLFQERLCRK